MLTAKSLRTSQFWKYYSMGVFSVLCAAILVQRISGDPKDCKIILFNYP